MVKNIDAPFEQYTDAIVTAAIEIRRANDEGVEPDSEASRIHLAQNLGDANPDDLYRARLAEAHLNVGARVVARVADLLDAKERGGLVGKVAGLELAITKTFEGKYLQKALEPGGAVDRVRGISAQG